MMTEPIAPEGQSAWARVAPSCVLAHGRGFLLRPGCDGRRGGNRLRPERQAMGCRRYSRRIVGDADRETLTPEDAPGGKHGMVVASRSNGGN